MASATAPCAATPLEAGLDRSWSSNSDLPTDLIEQTCHDYWQQTGSAVAGTIWLEGPSARAWALNQLRQRLQPNWKTKSSPGLCPPCRQGFVADQPVGRSASRPTGSELWPGSAKQ